MKIKRTTHYRPFVRTRHLTEQEAKGSEVNVCTPASEHRQYIGSNPRASTETRVLISRPEQQQLTPRSVVCALNLTDPRAQTIVCARLHSTVCRLHLATIIGFSIPMSSFN